jgi:hypothetical protein
MNENKNNEPIILGDLKKEKSSKPLFVFIVFALVLGVCFGLPYIGDYLSNADNYLSSIFNKNETNQSNESAESGDIDGIENNVNEIISDDLSVISGSTVLTLNNLTVESIEINDNTINYKVSSSADINLYSGDFYFEVYNQEKDLLGYIKLEGISSLESQIISQSIYFSGSENAQYIKLVEINSSDIDEVSLSNNTLTCSSNNNVYTYVFSDNLLKTINHEQTYNYISDINLYFSELNSAKSKSEIISNFTNCTSSTEDVDAGFKFNASLDLNYISVSDLDEYVDYNYYDLNTVSKIIYFEMKVKGFDCV